MTSENITERRGVYTAQISIAPVYHNDLLDEAKATGRTLVNIMASRVEEHGSLKAEITKLTEEVERLENTMTELAKRWPEIEAALTAYGEK